MVFCIKHHIRPVLCVVALQAQSGNMTGAYACNPVCPQESEAGVRIGDVYALLVEYCCEAGEAAQATALVEQMAARGIPLGPYLDAAMVNEAFQVRAFPARVLPACAVAYCFCFQSRPLLC